MNQACHSRLLILDGRQLPAAEVTSALQAICHRWPATWRQSSVLLGDEEVLGLDKIPCLTENDLASKLKRSTVEWVGYMPLNQCTSALPLSWPALEAGAWPFLAPWMPPQALPQETAKAADFAVGSWIATASLIRAALASLVDAADWSLLAIAQTLESQGIMFQWRVFAKDETIAEPVGKGMLSASVLAVIPHYCCEPWLQRCLMSLMQQTRPPDQVVVVDDGSPCPPQAILQDFPTVTLLAASTNVGPYRLIQQVIEDTAYDYYCFQDADDWSSCDRLARLLAKAIQTNADLVGTQEIRVDASSGSLTSVNYPLDVNAALRDKPGHPLLHPTSLVRRRLVRAVGGFATGLRFGGDTEFLLRAAWMGRIVNDDHYGYFRQKRPDSLTTDASTGLDSPARQALLTALKQRAYDNQAAYRQGLALNLVPLKRASPIALRHLAGPPLISSRESTLQRS